MNKIDEQFIKEKVNPVVGFIFHTARQLGQDNAPASMDMQYLKQGTEKVCELLREPPTAPPEPAKALEDARAFITQLGKADAVADRLGVSKRRVYEQSRAGAFNDFLVVLGDRQYRYDLAKLEEFIQNGGVRGAVQKDQ